VVTNPCCGYRVDTLEPLDTDQPNAKPQDGDILVCLNCGAALVWTNNLKNRRHLRLSDLESLSRLDRFLLDKAQKLITKRGWLPREEKRKS